MRALCEAQAGGGSGGGAEAADLGEPACDDALVSGEVHNEALVAHNEALVAFESGGARHLTLLALHVLVAAR